jgi:putative membrane protein
MITLPTLNALLNTTSALLLLAGYVAIRRRLRHFHRAAMLAACVSSTLFLTSYLVHHARVGSTPFQGQGLARTVYFAILLPHTLLAAGLVPLAILTLVRALRGRFPEHKAVARITLPIWLFVSASGVAVYLMLYRL